MKKHKISYKRQKRRNKKTQKKKKRGYMRLARQHRKKQNGCDTHNEETMHNMSSMGI